MYKVIAEVITTFDSKEEAISAYERQYTGDGVRGEDIHTVRVVDEDNNIIKDQKQWSIFTDNRGSRVVHSLHRE